MPTSRRRAVAVVALLLAATLLAYGRLPANDFVNFDDDRFIYENPLIRGLSAGHIRAFFTEQLGSPHYKPLVYLSWAIEYRLFGLAPTAYHLDNLLLHLVNTALVFALAHALLGAGRERSPLVAAGLVAALFALHPMRVESVAWAVERKDVLFAMFYLASLVLYVAFCRSGRRRLLLGSAATFALSLLSKSMAVTLPVVLWLVDFQLGRPLERRRISEKAGHLVVLLVALVLYGLVPGIHGSSGDVGTTTGLGSKASAIEIAGYRVLAFTGHLLLPRDLAVLYPPPEWLNQGSAARTAGFVVLWVVPALVLARSSRSARGPLFAVGFYLVTLSPALVISAAGTNLHPDRYTYLASIGLSSLLVILGLGVINRRPTWKPVLIGVAAGYLLFLASGTWRQVPTWRDSQSLWSHAIAARGESGIALNNRGLARVEGGHQLDALADFDRAIEIDPGNARALNNRSSVRKELGDLNGALADITRAVRLRPESALFHKNRGLVLAALGDLDGAIAEYTRALELVTDRDGLEARNSLLLLRGIARRDAGHLRPALVDLTAVVDSGAPDVVDALLYRATVRARFGDFAGAIADNSRVLEQHPDDSRALNNRARAYYHLGRHPLALEDLNAAIETRPDYALAYRNRGDVLHALGDVDGACREWGHAERLDESAEVLPHDEKVERLCP